MNEREEEPIPFIQESLINLKITPTTTFNEGGIGFNVKINFNQVSNDSTVHCLGMNKTSNLSSRCSQNTRKPQNSDLFISNFSDVEKTVKLYGANDSKCGANKECLREFEAYSQVFSEEEDAEKKEREPNVPLMAVDTDINEDIRNHPQALETKFTLNTNTNTGSDKSSSHESKNISSLVKTAEFENTRSPPKKDKEFKGIIRNAESKYNFDDQTLKKLEELEMKEYKDGADLKNRKLRYLCSPMSGMMEPGMEPSLTPNMEFWNDNDILENSAGLCRRSTEKTLTYSDAWSHLRTIPSSDEKKNWTTKLIKTAKNKNKFKIFFICHVPKPLKDMYQNDKAVFLCLSDIQYNISDQLHYGLLFTIYKSFGDIKARLMNEEIEKSLKKYGKHWEEIGFVGEDPTSNLAGVGLLGLLQILAFLSFQKDFLITMFKWSLNELHYYPLCATLLNISKITIEYLERGKLDQIIERNKSVMNAINNFYFSLAYSFFTDYIERGLKIIDIQGLLKKKRKEYWKKPSGCIEEFLKRFR